jgi:hypothetical protein
MKIVPSKLLLQLAWEKLDWDDREWALEAAAQILEYPEDVQMELILLLKTADQAKNAEQRISARGKFYSRLTELSLQYPDIKEKAATEAGKHAGWNLTAALGVLRRFAPSNK